MVLGVVLILGSLLAGCFGDTATTTADEEVLTLSDLKECGYTFREGIYVTCEDEEPRLEFVKGPPPAGWACSYRAGRDSPIQILWHPTEERFGVHVKGLEESYDLLVGSVALTHGFKTASFHWSSPNTQGHVLFPPGGPTPDLERYEVSFGFHGLAIENASPPLQHGQPSLIWSQAHPDAHPTLRMNTEDGQYYLPLWRNSGEVIENIGSALSHETKDFEFNMEKQYYFAVGEEIARVLPPSSSCVTDPWV